MGMSFVHIVNFSPRAGDDFLRVGKIARIQTQKTVVGPKTKFYLVRSEIVGAKQFCYAT